jgi:hypothetical protein
MLPVPMIPIFILPLISFFLGLKPEEFRLGKTNLQVGPGGPNPAPSSKRNAVAVGNLDKPRCHCDQNGQISSGAVALFPAFFRFFCESDFQRPHIIGLVTR